MTSARDEVLARVRSALGPDPELPEVPRGYRRAGQGPDGDLLDRLVDRLQDYRATVVRTNDAGVGTAIAGALRDARTVVVPPGLAPDWRPDSLEVIEDDSLDPAALDAVDAVVTASAVAIAETGTIVLDGAPDQGRRAITLVPDLHLCVVHADDVVATVPDGVAALDPRRPQTWISGPSATSDIELNRVEGVHGPRALVVILIE